jgi:hypothetical protein
MHNHHLAGLRFDAVGQRPRIMRRIIGELASLGQPASALTTWL